MTLFKIVPGLLVSSIILAGCADESQNVQPSYTSPIQYQSYSCKQISEESYRVSSRAAQLAGVQNKNAQNDAVATGVALVLFWPAAFLIHGNKQNSAELARLKGELNALEQASIRRNCSIKFQK